MHCNNLGIPGAADTLAATAQAADGRPMHFAHVQFYAYDRARRALLCDERLLTQVVLGLAAHPWLAHLALRLLKATPALFSPLIGIAGGVHECFYRAGLSDVFDSAHLA